MALKLFGANKVDGGKDTVVTRRSNIQIIGEILAQAGGSGISKTAIMYRVNMSHSQLEKYLAFLIQRSFIECLDSDRQTKYHTTKRGTQLLNDIGDMVQSLELDKLDEK
jgi:predicted transcriptional regulator